MGRALALNSIDTSSYVAGEAIQAGDLVTTDAAGKVYWAGDPGSLQHVARPTSLASAAQASAASSARPTLTAMGNDAGAQVMASALLSNNNLVTVYSDGTATTRFVITDPFGALVCAETTIAPAGSSINVNAVCALSGGGFAVAFSTLTSNLTKMAVYSNLGVQTLAPVTLRGAQTVAHKALAIAQISTGNIVVFWKEGNNCFYTILQTNGTVVLAATQANTTSSVSQLFGIALVALPSAGFMMIYGNATTVVTRVSGTTGMLSAEVLLTATTNATAMHLAATLLANGNVAVATIGLTAGQNTTAVLSAAGAVVGQLAGYDTTATTTQGAALLINVAPLASGGYVVTLTCNATNYRAYKFSNTATLTGAQLTFTTITPSSATDPHVVAAAGDQVTILSAPKSSLLRMTTIDGAAWAVLSDANTDITTPSVTQTDIAIVPMTTTLTGGLFNLYGVSAADSALDGIRTSTRYSYAFGLNVAGVAVGAASAAATVGVQTSGYAATRLAWTTGQTIVTQNPFTPPQKVSLLGTSVRMQGFAANTLRAIN